MTHGTRASAAPVRPAQLAQIALRIADHRGQWLPLVRYDPARHWYQLLARDEEHEVWLVSWLPGQQTGFHDHGLSAGAFAVARGFLCESAAPGDQPEPTGRTLAPGAVRSFGPQYVHDVRNGSAWPAVSIHAYSPPLSSIPRYGPHCTSGGTCSSDASILALRPVSGRSPATSCT